MRSHPSGFYNIVVNIKSWNTILLGDPFMRILVHYVFAIVVLTIYGGQV